MSDVAVFRPREADGLGAGAVLALLAHAVLVAALAWSVNWKTHDASVIEAEVWSEVPQAAAPQAAPPPPAEPVPRTRQSKAEPEDEEHPEAELAQAPQPKVKPKPKPKEKPPEKAKPKPVPEPVEAAVKKPPVVAKKPAPAVDAPPNPAVSNAAREAQRKANLQRMMNELGGLGQAPRSAGPSATYGGRLRARILPNIVFTGTVSGNPTAFVEIRCAPDGRILSRRLLDSSGAEDWDNAVLRGIDRTESLPMDENGRLPDTVFQIGFSPKDR